MLKSSHCFLLAALLSVPVTACRGEAPSPQAASQAQAVPRAPQAPAADPSAPGDSMESCDGLPLADKEACYARQAPDLMAECERMRLHHCAPYARMHESEKQLGQLNADLLQAAKKAYGSYEDSQPGYVKDLEESLADSDRTWRAYRDAHCNLDPLIQGMSRREAADLTEACRADKTAARVVEVKEMLATLKEEPNDEQRKQ